MLISSTPFPWHILLQPLIPLAMPLIECDILHFGGGKLHEAFKMTSIS